MESKRILVWLAGPITGDMMANTRAAVEVFHRLRDLGMYPFCPHLSCFSHYLKSRDYEDWMDYDLTWIEAMAAWPENSRFVPVLYVIAPSPGANREEAHAKEWGIPVVYTITGLLEWADRVTADY